MVLSNKQYDTLKWIATILLPALSVLYVALATVWAFPYSGEVSATIMAIVLFMNALLGLSNAQHKAQNNTK